MKFCDKEIQNHFLNGGKIKKSTHRYPLFLDSVGALCFVNNINFTYDYTITKKDLTDNDWEIVEPEYDWNKIIKDKVLCVFSHQENFKYITITTLDRRDNQNDTYFTHQGDWYRYCKPFNPADFNIAKDLKEYEK